MRARGVWRTDRDPCPGQKAGVQSEEVGCGRGTSVVSPHGSPPPPPQLFEGDRGHLPIRGQQTIAYDQVRSLTSHCTPVS